MPFPIAAAIMAGASIAGGLIQNSQNKKAATRKFKRDLKLMKYQNEYNSPKEQMARFDEAGLNPNLVYSQGNAGNMSSVPQAPMEEPAQWQAILPDAVLKMQQAKLMESQTSLNNIRVDESVVKQELMVAQKELVRANPYMNKSYVDSFVTQMQAIAALKKQEMQYMLSTTDAPLGSLDFSKGGIQVGHQKMFKEFEILSKRFDLMSSDQQIKSQVFQSKEFQNAILEIQKKFLADGELNASHWVAFTKMILASFMK